MNCFSPFYRSITIWTNQGYSTFQYYFIEHVKKQNPFGVPHNGMIQVYFVLYALEPNGPKTKRIQFGRIEINGKIW